jgi:hypothetical protein
MRHFSAARCSRFSEADSNVADKTIGEDMQDSLGMHALSLRAWWLMA